MKSTEIKFEPAMTCSTVGCGRPTTVAMVDPGPPQLGEFMQFPPVGPVFLMMPICERCVRTMLAVYDDGHR